MIAEIAAWGSPSALAAFFFWKAYATARGPVVKPRLVQPAPPQPLGTPWLDYCRDAEAQEAEMYQLCPSAFWLHPDGPLAPIPQPEAPQTLKPEWGPPCPNACNAPLLVMAEHGGEATMWSCTLCGTDYTRAGKSKTAGKLARAKQEARRRRDRAAEMRAFELGLDSPQAAMRRQDEAFVEAWSRPPGVPHAAYVNPTATYRITDSANRGWSPLPCGCPGDTPIVEERRTNWGITVRYSKCTRCAAVWEPPSNDSTGRKLAQGERVHR